MSDHRAGEPENLDVSRLRQSSRPLVVERLLVDRWLVLGSRQRLDEVLGEPGLRVVRRRGGGGAVLLDPLDSIWIDLWLPSGSPGYLDDVRGQLELVGAIMREALEVAGLAGLALATPVAPVGVEPLCFLGEGPGEIVDEGGAKLVGLAAWRAREGALVQCALYRRRDLRLPELLVLEPEARQAASQALFERVADLEQLGRADLDATALAESIAGRLGAELERRPPELVGG